MWMPAGLNNKFWGRP